jgi:hypothetical protein
MKGSRIASLLIIAILASSGVAYAGFSIDRFPSNEQTSEMPSSAPNGNLSVDPPSYSGYNSYTWLVFTQNVTGEQYYFAELGVPLVISGVAYNQGQVVYGGPANSGGVTGTSFSSVMQSAINACASIGGCVIVLGNGHFSVGSTIDLYNDIHIVGQGSAGQAYYSKIVGTLVQVELGPTVLLGNSGVSSMFYTPTPNSLGIYVIGVSFDAAKSAIALNLDGVHFSEVANCYFAGFTREAIYASATKADEYFAQDWILYNTFWGNSIGIKIQGSFQPKSGFAENALVQGNWFLGNPLGSDIGIQFAAPITSSCNGSCLDGHIDAFGVDHNSFLALAIGVDLVSDKGSQIIWNDFEGNRVDIQIGTGATILYIATYIAFNQESNFLPLNFVFGAPSATPFTGYLVDNAGYNPVGRLTKPWNIGAKSVGLSGSSSLPDKSGTVWKINGVDASFSCSGGGKVSITVKDKSSNVVGGPYTCLTLPTTFYPVGYTLVITNSSPFLTFNVFGN